MAKVKRIIILTCVVVLIIFIAVVYWSIFRERSGAEILFSRNIITHAKITNGINGSETKLSGSDIDLIYNDLQDIYFQRVDVEETSGWSYYIDFYSGKKYVRFLIKSDEVWEINDINYKLSSVADGKKVVNDIISVFENQ